MSDLIPSPAAIVYGAADLFTPPAPKIGLFTIVPCTETRVVSWELAVQLFCVTLADMIHQGLITLQVVEATKLFVIHTRNVVVHLTPEAGARLPQTGLASWLARTILAHNGENIHNIIRAAYGQDYPSPSSVPIYMASQELMALGFYADSVREIGGLGGMLRKAVHASTTEHVPVPICEHFTALRASAPTVQQMLQSVSSHDPQLWAMLHAQVNHAMKSRVEAQDNTANVG